MNFLSERGGELVISLRGAGTSSDTRDTHALIIRPFIGSPAINLYYVLPGDTAPSAAAASKG